MTEGGEHNIIPESAKRRYRRFRRRTAKLARELDLSLDSKAKAARDIIFPVGIAMAIYQKDSTLPKILQLKTPNKEYVSIRRLKGSQIEQLSRRLEPESGDVFETMLKFFYPSEKLDEGQIAILVLPCWYLCKRKKREREIDQEIGDKIRIFGGETWYAMMSERPDLFRKEDWYPKWMEIFVATKKGQNLYVAEVAIDGSVYGFRKVKPDEKGNFELAFHSYFQSETQLNAEMRFIREFGKFYILEEGSSQTERKGRPLKKLVLSPHRVVG